MEWGPTVAVLLALLWALYEYVLKETVEALAKLIKRFVLCPVNWIRRGRFKISEADYHVADRTIYITLYHKGKGALTIDQVRLRQGENNDPPIPLTPYVEYRRAGKKGAPFTIPDEDRKPRLYVNTSGLDPRVQRRIDEACADESTIMVEMKACRHHPRKKKLVESCEMMCS